MQVAYGLGVLMERIIRAVVLSLGIAVPYLGFAAPADTPVAAADVVSGVWQHHKITINYFGITASYACDALEDHVKSILLHLGARRDAKVSASCPRGPEIPSHNAWIETDFYTLAPAEAASSSDTVKAYWAPREVNPHQPFFMGDGDCELIEQMKDMISKSFALRDMQYHTECVPHELTINGFSIKGQALVPVAAPAGAKGA
jgi:hypothetical protein